MATLRQSSPTGAAPVSDHRPQPFGLDVERRGAVAIVQPHGELDLATAETLQATLDGIDDAESLVLDLRGLSFIDSSGLHLLVAVHQRAQRHGFQLALVMPPPPADQTIELSGLAQVLPFLPPAEALTSAPPTDAPGRATTTPADPIRQPSGTST